MSSTPRAIGPSRNRRVSETGRRRNDKCKIVNCNSKASKNGESSTSLEQGKRRRYSIKEFSKISEKYEFLQEEVKKLQTALLEEQIVNYRHEMSINKLRQKCKDIERENVMLKEKLIEPGNLKIKIKRKIAGLKIAENNPETESNQESIWQHLINRVASRISSNENSRSMDEIWMLLEKIKENSQDKVSKIY